LEADQPYILKGGFIQFGVNWNVIAQVVKFDKELIMLK
jgi:hypothetical protein